MAWLIILIFLFLALHFFLLVPTQLAIASAAVLTVVLWIFWRVKWILLAIIGLEEVFGDRGNDT